MIPKFPKFTYLQLKHRTKIESYTDRLPPYSDYNFVSLWSYNIKNDIIISQLNRNLVIRFRHYITSKPFYSFIGNQSPIRTARELLRLSKKQGLQEKLELIPQSVIKNSPNFKKIFTVKDDKDNCDFILSLKNMALLPGSKYSKKRWRIKRFIKANPDYEIIELNLSNRKVQKEILKIFNYRSKIINTSPEDVTIEKIALKRIMYHHSQLNIIGIGFYIKKELAGFVINELTNDGIMIGHFIKANTDHRWIYDFMYHKIGKFFYAKGYKYINVLQDMGVKNLRIAKQSWKPITYLSKYTIVPIPHSDKQR